jgi:hypothetical protein
MRIRQIETFLPGLDMSDQVRGYCASMHARLRAVEQLINSLSASLQSNGDNAEHVLTAMAARLDRDLATRGIKGVTTVLFDARNQAGR